MAILHELIEDRRNGTEVVAHAFVVAGFRDACEQAACLLTSELLFFSSVFRVG